LERLPESCCEVERPFPRPRSAFLLFACYGLGRRLRRQPPNGFVRLAEIDPTIRQDMRYAGSLNFIGRPAKGYEAPVCILSEPAARALATAQKKLAAEGMSLVVFDCRPQSATDDFITWIGQGGAKDPRWHPKVKRGDLITEGYVGARSSHSRGSTVDVALAPVCQLRRLAAPAMPPCSTLAPASTA
jgi:D-alanyl-D-alanine dipeptidase